MLSYGLTWGVPVTQQPSAYRVPGGTYGTLRYDADQELRPELIQAPGPAAIGVTGAGTAADLHGTPWYLAWTDLGLDLARRTGSGWTSTTDTSALPTLPAGARHLGLAFDQAARPVLAWDDDAQLQIRQWDASAQGYLNRGPFPGVDPVLLADLAVQGDVPASDVLAFYLSPARDALCFRVQRENYALEHVALTGLDGWVLDQVNYFPSAAQLVGEDASGAEVTVGIGPYPRQLTGQDQGRAAAVAPSGGALTTLVLVRDGADPAQGTARAPAGGALVEVVRVFQGADPLGSAALAPAGGGLVQVVLLGQGTDPSTAAALAPAGGALTIIVITASGASAASASVLAPSGGSLV